MDGKIVANKGFDFSNGATFFISFYEDPYLKTLINAILSDVFSERPQLFKLASPVFIKRAKEGSNDYKFYLYTDEESSALMTETLKHKMREAELPEDDTLKIEFDLNYANKRQKMVTIHGIKNLASMCPVIVHGKPESKLFAWITGIGSGTGSGFGSLL